MIIIDIIIGIKFKFISGSKYFYNVFSFHKHFSVLKKQKQYRVSVSYLRHITCITYTDTYNIMVLYCFIFYEY